MAEQPGIIRFGVFEVNLAAGELRKNGTRIKLQEQPFQVLAALLERPGEVVTKDELKERLWAGDTFVDFDHSLSTAVNKIREALGDSASSPRFIETVPRRGYRFIGELRTPAIDERPAASDTPEGRNRISRTRRARLSLVLVVIAPLLAVTFWALFNRGPRKSNGTGAAVQMVEAIPVTATLGREMYPSLSPDSSQVAFSGDQDGERGLDIYVKVVDNGAALQLTTHPNDEVSPAWSPDGKTIAFVRLGPDVRFEVYLIPALSGAEEKVYELDGLPALHPATGALIAWTPDSRRLAVPCHVEATAGLGICLLSIETRETIPLTAPPAEFMGDSSPAFSPDGRRLAFVRQQSYKRGGMLYVLDLDDDLVPSGEPRRFAPGHQAVGSPAWTPEGNEIVFFAARTEWNSAIWRMPAHHGAEPSLVYPVANQSTLSIARNRSPNGVRLVYWAQSHDSNIWRIRLSESGTDPPDKDRFISSTWRDGQPQYSPDGRLVAFISARTGAEELWLCDSDGSNAHPITKLNAAIVGFPRWSSDSSRIVFHARLEVQADIYVIDVDERLLRSLTKTPMDEVAPAWSRDDLWIYFAQLTSGGPQLWKVPIEGKTPIQLTSQGGMIPSESWDGQIVYYVKPSGGLFQMPIAEQLLEGPESQLVGSVNPYSYFVAKHGIYFVEGNSPSSRGSNYAESLKFLDLTNGKVTEVVPIHGRVGFGLTVSRDGRTILYTHADNTGPDLMMLEGFR